MSGLPAPHHTVITVTDLSVSRPWYQALFQTEPVLDEDTGPFHHCAWAFPNGYLVSLHEFHDAPKGDRFDERRIGLDHLAFGLASRAELEEWVARLDEMGIEHGKIVDAHYGSAVAFRDPDNIQLELFAPPA